MRFLVEGHNSYDALYRKYIMGSLIIPFSCLTVCRWWRDVTLMVWWTKRKIDLYDIIPQPLSVWCIFQPAPDTGVIAHVLEKTYGRVRDLVLPEHLKLGDRSLHAFSKRVIFIERAMLSAEAGDVYKESGFSHSV